MTHGTLCTRLFDGLGTSCSRCGSWTRGRATPECPPYVTRCEPDNARLPHIKTPEQNTQARLDWLALADGETHER